MKKNGGERHPLMGLRVFIDQHVNTFQSFIDSPRTMLPHALQVTRRSAVRQELRSKIKGKEIGPGGPGLFNDHEHIAVHGDIDEMSGSDFAARIVVLPRRLRHSFIERRRSKVLRYFSPEYSDDE